MERDGAEPADGEKQRPCAAAYVGKPDEISIRRGPGHVTAKTVHDPENHQREPTQETRGFHVCLFDQLRCGSRHVQEKRLHDGETGAGREPNQDAIERRANGKIIENPFRLLFGEPGVEPLAQGHQRERGALRVQSRPNQRRPRTPRSDLPTPEPQFNTDRVRPLITRCQRWLCKAMPARPGLQTTATSLMEGTWPSRWESTSPRTSIGFARSIRTRAS